MPHTSSRRSTVKRSTRSGKRQSRIHKWFHTARIADLILRYSKGFTIVMPTLFNVCDYWFKKDQNRLRDIRPDTLSQILNLASIRPGGKYLAVDDASGIVVAGILQRLGGSGRLITICDIETPPAYPCMVHLNFEKEYTSIMSSLNWATADEEYTPSQYLRICGSRTHLAYFVYDSPSFRGAALGDIQVRRPKDTSEQAKARLRCAYANA